MRRIFYFSLRAISSLKFWAARHFTRQGLFVLGGLVVSAVLGVDTNQTMAYQIFTLLLALLSVALVGSLFLKPSFAAQRTAPRHVTAGQPFVCRIALHNKTGKMQGGLTLLENLADPRPSFGEYASAATGPRNRFSWTRGYRFWQRLVAGNKNAETKAQDLPLLPPVGSTEIRIETTPLRRGYVRFTGVTVARQDPLGLFMACAQIPAEQSVLVLPKRYALPDIPLPGIRQYQPGGVTLASSVGDSEEFIGLRDYRPGDPLQRIHWKSFARAGKPVVKEFQDEYFERHALVLDTFLQSGSDEVFEEAVSVAASFACAINTQECLLDLMFVGAEAYCFSAGRGQLQTENMLEILAGVQAIGGRPFSDLQRSVIGRRPALSGCICILLEWDEARQNFIKHLQSLGLPVLVLVIAAAPVEGVQTDWLHILEPGNIQQGLSQL